MVGCRGSEGGGGERIEGREGERGRERRIERESGREESRAE